MIVEIKRPVGEFMRYRRCIAVGLAFIICLAVDKAFGVTNVTTGGEATWSATEREVLFQKLLAEYCAVLKSAPPDAPVAVKLGGWPALQIPSCSIMGLVLLGEGNTRTRGPYAAQLDKLYKYVAVTASKDEQAIKSHESWMLAFAILFLSEMHRAEPSEGLHHRIEALVKRLEAGRHGDKGWCHTLKHTNYGPFVGVTIWCAAALAAAAEQGVAVDKEGLAAALRTLRNSVSSAGGAGYFDHPDNTASVGRAAGVAWVLTRYGAGNETEIARCRAFLARHADVAPLGHGSWMMHMTLSAVCAACADETTRETFWMAQRPSLFRARAPNGFFRIQAWEETGFNGDVCVNLGREKTWPDPMYGDAWATVWMFLAWQAERGKCLLARKPPPPAVVVRASQPSLPALDEAAILEKIKAGRGLEAQQTLGELVRKFPDDARLYRLHALANIPALIEPFSADVKAFATGWGATVEANALRDLAASLSKQSGKGDISEEFDAGVHLLRARIFAKQTLTTFNPKSVAWVQANNLFVAEIRALQKMGAMGVEAVALTRCVNAKLAVLAK